MTSGKQLTGKKRLLFHLLYFPLVLILVFSVVEISARLMGYRPWTITNADIKVEPGGRFYHSGLLN